MKATRSLVYYRSRKDPLTTLRQRMREVAQTRVRFGYRRLLVLTKPLDRTAPLRQRALRPENDQAEGNRGCKV